MLNQHRKIANVACRKQPETQFDDANSNGSSFSSGRSNDVPKFYSDTENIDLWNRGVVPGSAPPEDRLSSGRDVLRASEAYKWLVATVRRGVDMRGIDPRQMNDHGNWLLNVLEINTPRKYRKVSRRRRPALYTVKIELSCDLQGFFQSQAYEEYDPSVILSSVITLSGDQSSVQALPCWRYMEQTWPLTGVEVSELLERVIEAPTQHHQCKRPHLSPLDHACCYNYFIKVVLSDKTELSASSRDSTLSVHVTGTKYGSVEVFQQILWIFSCSSDTD